MTRRKASDDEIEENKKQEEVRIKAARASRRSGKSIKREGKVGKSKAKAKEPRSQKKIATIKKSRY